MPQNNQWRRTARTDPVYALTDVYSGKLVKQAHFFINEITTRFQSSLLDGTSSHYLCSRCLRAIEKGRQCQSGYGCNRNRLKRGGAAAANGPALAAGPTVNDDVAGCRCKIKTAMKPDVEEGEVSEDDPPPTPQRSHRSVEEQVRDFLKKTEGVVSNGAGSAVPTTLSPVPTSTTSRSSSSSGGGGVSGLHQRQQSPSQPSTPDKRSHPRRDSRDLATEYSSFNKCKNYLKEGQSLDVTKFKRCTCCVLRHTFPDCMAWLWSSMESLPTIKSDTSA